MLLRVPLFLPAVAALALCQLCSFNSLQKHKFSVLFITQIHTSTCRFQSWWGSSSGKTRNDTRSDASHSAAVSTYIHSQICTRDVLGEKWIKNQLLIKQDF